jgi:glycosyltransferase involved in cell wall biosynthesis
MPKVSVIIPAYNAERFIAQSVRSATEQSYADIEVIVVDDGSRDDTARIASGYPGVHVLRQANAGVSAARNAGVHASSGELVAFLDADDVWHADKIATQVALLEQYRDSDLTYTRVDHHAPDPSLDIRAEQHSLIADLATMFLNP